MTVKFYTFTKKQQSTKQPAADSGTSYTVTIRSPSSVLHPVIELQGVSDPHAYNYAYIPAYSRYYWVRNLTWEAGLWVLNLDVDALATWRSGIGSSTHYVLRSSHSYDGDLQDSLYPTGSVPTITYTIGARPWSAGETVYGGGSYVIGLIGRGPGSVGGVTYYSLDSSQMTSLMEYLLGDGEYLRDVTSLFDTKAEFNPQQYIASATWFPFSVGGVAVSVLPFGWWSAPVGGKLLSGGMWMGNRYYSVDAPAHPQAATRGDYLNYRPYTQYDLYFPGIGMVPIDNEYARSGAAKINLTVRVDYLTGTASLIVGDVDNNSQTVNTIMTGKIGVSIPISQISRSNYGLMAAAVSMAAPLLTGNVLGAAAGISNAVQAAMPQARISGSQDSMADLVGAICLKTTCWPVVDSYNTDLGRPLCQARQLSSIPGYIQTHDGDIQLPATAEELQTINAALTGGFFYE